MKLMKCANGHFFDNDKYASCPYCKKDQDARTESEYATAVMDEAPSESEEAAAADRTGLETESAENEGQEAAKNAAKENSREIPVWHPAGTDSRTVSFYARTIGTEPVVGWLVAIEGPYFGEDFKLKSGRNFIGRSPEMDIQLGMDMSVSRRRHAVIIYEPRGKVFIAQPGDSRELFYLNDEVVLSNVQIKPYDVLSIGETKLLFLPLCGREFSWDAVKKEQ